MRVIQQTKDRLRVRHTPWLLGGVMWLMGAAALWAGLFDAQAIDDLWERALVGALGLATLAGAWWFAPMKSR